MKAVTSLSTATAAGLQLWVLPRVVVFVVSMVALSAAGEAPLRKLYSFDEEAVVAAWRPVDDRVMGGVSRSRLTSFAGGASYVGDLSLEQGGGFASIRSRDTPMDLTKCSAIVLRARGDGKRYKLSLRTDGEFDGVVYQASFDTSPDEWQDVVLPINDLVATRRGRTLKSASPLDRARVMSLGLLISDSQAGPFRLDIAWIGVACDLPESSTSGPDRSGEKTP